MKKKIKLPKLKNEGEKQKRKLLRKQLVKEGKLVRSTSMKVLHEFEKLGYQEMAGESKRIMRDFKRLDNEALKYRDGA